MSSTKRNNISLLQPSNEKIFPNKNDFPSGHSSLGYTQPPIGLPNISKETSAAARHTSMGFTSNTYSIENAPIDLNSSLIKMSENDKYLLLEMQ